MIIIIIIITIKTALPHLICYFLKGAIIYDGKDIYNMKPNIVSNNILSLFRH